MSKRTMTAQQRKEYDEIVERIVASLPPEARDVLRQVAAEIVEAGGDPKDLDSKFGEAFSTAMNTAKPQKTIKLKPRVAKQVKEDAAWVEGLKARAKKIDEKETAIKKEKAEIINEVKARKEALNALILVEHGISHTKEVFRVNEKTMEIEIMMKYDVLKAEAAKVGTSL